MTNYPQKTISLSVLIVLLISGAFWILRTGSNLNEGKGQRRGMDPAATQRTTVRAETPYQLTNMSWDDAGDLEHLRRVKPPQVDLMGLEVAVRR